MKGPVGRFAAVLGLVMLFPIAFQMISGALSVPDAAIRAGITLVAVLLIQRLGRIGVNTIASSMERMAEPVPRRRATD